jgi:hypothetical protein
MMKKELLVKNLGQGSYRGAVSFMYGISKVLELQKSLCYSVIQESSVLESRFNQFPKQVQKTPRPATLDVLHHFDS